MNNCFVIQRCAFAIRYSAAVAALMLAGSCNNPFLPPTGVPLASKPPRSTPAGVVFQLKTAYETRSISLFKDLFGTSQTYRFYISPSYMIDPDRKLTNYLSESFSDTIFSPGIRTTYNYWTWQDEMVRHANMFELTSKIQFSDTVPYALTTSYLVNETIDTTDTMRVNDTLRYTIQIEYDTINAKVTMTGGVIELYMADTPLDPYLIGIKQQVFYLIRDPVDPALWIIEKWFDLGT